MLELLKSKNNGSSTKGKSSTSNSDEPSKKKKEKKYVDTPNGHGFKRELGQMRRPAYIVRLNGKMI